MTIHRDSEGRLQPPRYKSDVPPFLLQKSTDAERWMLENASIARQQNDWLINVAINADERLHLSERELAKLRKLRWILAGKWSVIAFIVLSLLIPGGLAWLAVKLAK